MGIISTNFINSQHTPSINVQDGILCYLPKTFKDQIKDILASSDQIDSVVMICDFTASWIQILDDETQEKVYNCFSKICRPALAEDAIWGKDHIQDPDKAKALYKSLRSVFPEKSNILIENRLISFVKSEFGIQLVKYLDRESFAKLSTTCSELIRAVPDMYARGGICMLQAFAPKNNLEQTLVVPLGLNLPDTIERVADIADGIFYRDNTLIAYSSLCDFIFEHGTNILYQYFEPDVFNEIRMQRDLDLLSRLVSNFHTRELDNFFYKSLDSEWFEGAIIIDNNIKEFDIHRRADFIASAKRLGRLSDVQNYCTEIKDLIPEQDEDAEYYLGQMIERSNHVEKLLLNGNFDEVYAKINEGEIVLDIHLETFIDFATKLNDPVLLEKVISHSHHQSYFRGKAVSSLIQNELFDAAYALLSNSNELSDRHRGNSAIYAAEHNNFELVEFLLADNKKIDVKSAGHALRVFVEKSRTDLVERFIYDYPGISSDDRAEAAISAVKSNYVELAEFLISSPQPISHHILERLDLEISTNFSHNLRIDDFSKVGFAISILKKISIINRHFENRIKSKINYHFLNQVEINNIDMVQFLLSLDVEIPVSVLRLLHEGPSRRLTKEMHDLLTSKII